jgi:2,4-dienoyl-CoA reductase-like NADH-dependent reductase (Old Yellow Enzyme family)
LPVVAFGCVGPPQRVEQRLRDGEADLIGWTRQLVTDPETPNKLRARRGDLVRYCISRNDACLH